MSASNQKKIRQQEREVYRSERERQEALEAKKLRKQTIAFVVVIAICLSIFLGSFLVSPFKNVLYKNTIAVTVGNHDLTSVDVNYFYVDAINNYINQYYYYIYLGYITLDFNTPLDQQPVSKDSKETWADSFLSMAVESIKSTYALYDLAMKDDHKLSDEEVADIASIEGSLKENAKQAGYKNVNQLLRATYGNGATLDSYLNYYTICTYASSYYTAHEDSLVYDDATLREFEGEEGYKYNSYSYAHYLINVSDFLPNKASSEITAEETKAAEKACKEFAEKLAAGEFATVEELDAAIDAAIKELKGETKKEETNDGTATQDETGNEEDQPVDGGNDEVTPDDGENDETTPDETEKEEEKPNLKYTSTKQNDLLYSSVNSLFQDWIIGKLPADSDAEAEGESDKKDKFEERKEGDMTVIEYTTGTGDSKTIKGYYVVRFESCTDNAFALADIRHILIKFEGGTTNSTTGQTTYTDAQKNAAKAAAEKLYNEYKEAIKDKDTAKAEEIFAELAKLNSGDSNAAQGGLYEAVYPGQMVTSFNNWCFAKGDYADEAPRKAGDHGLVETEYGWHLMFYVDDNEETYRDYMVSKDKRAKDMEEWYDGILKSAKYEEKNMKHVKTDLILNG